MLDRKHVFTIADSARVTLQSAHAFLNATRDGKGTRLNNTLNLKWECNLGELRRRMAAAGCFKLRHRLFPTAEEQEAHDALETLAKDVGENPQAPLVASAPPPLPDEASAARLAEVVTALEKFLPAPPSEPTTDPKFIHSPRTRKILEMLNGKSKKLAQLADILNVSEAQLSGRELKELKKGGLVKWARRIGYYRPDAPPADVVP